MGNIRNSRNLQGIVKGHRWRVSPGIQEMNQRSEDCNHAAPWYGNHPGAVRSNAYQNHMLEVAGYEPCDCCDYDDSFDYDELMF